MKELGLIAGALALAGCGAFDDGSSRAIRVCEKIVTDQLRSPSTYGRISVMTEDAVQGRGVRSIFITYDAANAFGTPVRGAQQCAFEVDPETGAFPSELELGTQAISAETDILEHQNEVNAGRADPDPYEALLPCCLSREVREREIAKLLSQDN